MNVRAVTEIIGELAILKYFPADEHGRAAIVRLICQMASTEDQVRWLVRRAVSIYNEWPGPVELRACFCSKFRPRDGINAYSQVYCDGIPSEKEAALAISGPQALALPPGRVASADGDMERAVRSAADQISKPRRTQ